LFASVTDRYDLIRERLLGRSVERFGVDGTRCVVLRLTSEVESKMLI
jgi:hypothetical protein